MLRSPCHRIDDQLQAELRETGKGSRAQDGNQRGDMQQRTLLDVVPQKGHRPARKVGGDEES